MADPTSEQTGRLANITGDDDVPASRLSTANSARSMLSSLINGDNVASMMRTRVQAHIDGATPFSQAQLEAANQGYRSNVNHGGARARIRDYLTAYTDLLISSSPLFNVQITKGDPMKRAEYGQIYSEEFHRMLFETTTDWSFSYHMELHHKQLAIHGIGPCFWPDTRDWRFRATKRRNILVPKESPSDPARLPVVFVRDWMYVDEVYKHVRKNRDGSKWNRNAAFAAIKNAQKVDKDKFSFEAAEQKWKNNAWDWSYNESDVVLVAHAFVKEFNGTISHHIFTENSSGDYVPSASDSGYLYSAEDEFKSMTQAVWVCFQDVGNGDFESVRGLGTEAYSWGEAQNRLLNGLLDNAIEGSATIWQGETTDIANKLTRIEWGANRIFPAGLHKLENNVGAAVQSTLAVANYFTQMEEQNTGVYRTRATTPNNQARTATEIQAEIGQTSKLNNASVGHYCSQADLLGSETFNRATKATILPSDGGGKEALAFKDRVLERGVPEELFHELADTARVTIVRPIGNGSYGDRIQRMDAIGQSIGDMPDRKRKQYVRDRISYIGGNRELADRYGPDLEQDFPGIEQSLAILENNGLQAGGQQDPFSPDNAHTVHLPIHLEFAAMLLQGPPEQSAPILPVLYRHIAQHVDALENDPTRRAEYEQFKTQLGAMQNAMKQAVRMAELAAANQPAQQPSPEEQKAQAEIQLEAQKTQAAVADKAAKTRVGIATKDATTAQNIRHAEERARQQREAHDQAMRQSAEKHAQEMRLIAEQKARESKEPANA